MWRNMKTEDGIGGTLWIPAAPTPLRRSRREDRKRRRRPVSLSFIPTLNISRVSALESFCCALIGRIN